MGQGACCEVVEQDCNTHVGGHQTASINWMMMMMIDGQ